MNTYSTEKPETPRNYGDYDAPHTTAVTPAEDIRSIMINRVSWGAVFAGVVVALVTQLILNLGGISLGIITLNSATTSQTIGTLSLEAGIWWAVSGIVASFIGGYTAGRLAGEPRESTAGWHGLTSWAASVLVLTAFILIGGGTVMGGTLNTVRFNSTAAMNGQYNNAPSATAEMSAQNLAQTQGIPLDEARARIQQTTPATPTASTTLTPADATALSQGALVSVIALLLGALAAVWGGTLGAVKPTITNVRMRVH